MKRSILIPILISVVSACGSSAPAPASPAPAGGEAALAGEPGATASADGDSAEAYQRAMDVCGQIMVRQRACPEEFMTMLVDLRIKHDLPAGIAQDGSTPDGRAALIAHAMEEFRADDDPSQDEKRCAYLVTSVSAEKRGEMMGYAQGCAEAPACGEFATCMTPIQESMIKR